jgi:hypothetical protein
VEYFVEHFLVGDLHGDVGVSDPPVRDNRFDCEGD